MVFSPQCYYILEQHILKRSKLTAHTCDTWLMQSLSTQICSWLASVCSVLYIPSPFHFIGLVQTINPLNFYSPCTGCARILRAAHQCFLFTTLQYLSKITRLVIERPELLDEDAVGSFGMRCYPQQGEEKHLGKAPGQFRPSWHFLCQILTRGELRRLQ